MRTVAMILAVTVAGSGCSLAAARGPGPVRADRRPDCNSGKGAVFADGLAASVLGVLALAAAGESAGTAAVAGLSSVVFVTSAVTGSRSADRCRAAIAQYDDLLAVRERAAERDRREASAPPDPAGATAPGAAVGQAPAVPASAGAGAGRRSRRGRRAPAAAATARAAGWHRAAHATRAVGRDRAGRGGRRPGRRGVRRR
ncbi:MAG: hypothetical protein R3B06_08590 [Kofleriaceae bacterium]